MTTSQYDSKRANARKLREAARIGMSHPVLLGLDVDEVRTMSLAPWSDATKVSIFRVKNRDLGTFAVMACESQYDLFLRMWEEAACAGAMLGGLPTAEWVLLAGVPTPV